MLGRPGPIAGEIELAAEHHVVFDYDNFPGRVVIFSDTEASELAEIVRKADEQTKDERSQKLLDIISERSSKKWEKILADFGGPPSFEGPPKFE